MSKVFILMGLPGSGKTYFANEYYKTHNNTSRNNFKAVHIIDMDKYLKKYKLEDLSRLYGIGDNKTTYILDGLFLKNDEVISVIKSFNQNKPYACEIESITIHYWFPDREDCLYNDIGRRKESSKITIRYAEIEKPDVERIKNEIHCPINVVNHTVIRKPEWKAAADNFGIQVKNEKYLYSSEWCLGGTCGSCYSSELSRISPDEPILEFLELDSLLKDICPKLTFIDYKKIKNECVKTKTRSDRDYYGGCVEYAYFECDVEKLFNMLIEFDYINVKE